jgi:hypothetical protein
MKRPFPKFALRTSAVWLVAALLMQTPSSVFAETSYGIYAYGGYSLYAMDDMNDNLDNAAFLGPAGTSADPMDDGWSFGAGYRMWPNARSYVEIDFGYLHAGTNGSGTPPGSAPYGELDASGVALTASYAMLPWLVGRTRFGFAAGGGYYFTSGTTTASPSGATDIEGGGPGVHASFVVDRRLGTKFHVDGAIGYRHARTTKARVLGNDVLNDDGSNTTIDWSGPFLRLGLAFYPKGWR